MNVLEWGYKIMKQETFKQLSLEKQMELYNDWLIINHLDEYVLYPNDEEGIELCIERVFSSMCSNVDFVNELTHSIHYDTSDRLIMYDRDIPFGFKSLTEEEIKERFENEDFLECINQVEEFETLLNLDKRGLKHE